MFTLPLPFPLPLPLPPVTMVVVFSFPVLGALHLKQASFDPKTEAEHLEQIQSEVFGAELIVAPCI